MQDQCIETNTNCNINV